MKASSKNSSQSSENRVSQVVFADSMQSQPSLNLLEILRRQRWIIFATVSLGTALAAVYWTKATPWYESTAKILVSQRDPGLASAETGATTQSQDMVDEDVLANHMEVLRSRRIVGGALDRHQLAGLPSITEHLDDPEMDAADYVIDHLKLSRGGEGTAKDARSLSIRFEHTQPDDARLVLEAIVVEYQQFLGEQMSTAMSEANNIVQKGRNNLEEELETIQQEYLTLLHNAPILFEDGATNVLKEKYRRLYEELVNLELQESSTKSRLEEAKAVLAGKTEGQEIEIDDLGVIDTDSLNRLGVFAGLQASTARSAEFQADQPERQEDAGINGSLRLRLLTEKRRLEADFGPGHPNVKKIDEEIAVVDAFLEERKSDLSPGWGDTQLSPEGLLKAYVAFLKSDITSVAERRLELGILLAEAEKQASVFVEFEVKEGMLKSRLERTQSLFDGLVEQLRGLDLASGMRGYIHELLEAPRKGEQVWPSLALCGVAGLMLGLIGGLFFAVVNDQLDKRFRNSSEIDSAIGLPVLARVGRIKTDGMLPVVPDNSPEGESFRMLRTLLLNDIRSGQLKILSATSPLPGDGKTTVLINVAAAFAKLNMSVVLIEADMRRPTFHKRFNLPEDIGLSDLLKGKGTIDEVLVPSGVPNLTLITAGSGAANPSELLQHEPFDELLKALSQRFDLVIVDVGPVLAVSDPVIVSQKCDGMLLVVRSSNDTRQQVMDAVDTLRSAGAKLLGCILNTYGSGHEFERTGYYGYYYSDRKPGKHLNGEAVPAGEIDRNSR